MSLRARLNLLVLLAIIPLAALLVYTNIEERHRDIETAKNDALAGLQFVKINLGLRVEEAHELLLTLSQASEMRSGDVSACVATLRDLSKWYPDYVEFGLATPNGDIVCQEGSAPQSVFVPGRQAQAAWFQRALTGRDFAVGDYQVDAETGQPILTFSFPVLDRSGQVQGVVYAVSRMSQLHELTPETPSPTQVDLLVLDRHGTILDRQPQPENWIGRTLTQTSLIQTILTQEEGVIDVNGIDGVDRLYAFAPVRALTETDLYICAGVPTETVMAEANKTLLLNLLALIPITALALVTASFFANALILRHVTSLREAAQRLRRGDLRARSRALAQTVELDELAVTFNEMDSTLEQREAQHQAVEDILREQRAMLQTTLTSMGDAVITTDASGQVAFLNPIAEALTGWIQAEAAGQPLNAVLTLITEGSAQPHESLATRILHDDVMVGLANHTLLINRQGRSVAVDVSGAPIRSVTGDISGVVFVFRDITERRHAEEELYKTNMVMQAVFEGTTDSIFVKDRQGRYLLANSATARSIGQPIQNILGRDDAELYPPETAQRLMAADQQVIASGQSQTLEEIITLPTGTRTYHSVKAPYRDVQDSVIGLIGISRDVTALKESTRAQQLLAEIARLLTASLDDESRLAQVAGILIPSLADCCVIEAIADDHLTQRVAAQHIDPAKAALAEELYRRHPPSWNTHEGEIDALRSGQPTLFPNLNDASLEIETNHYERLQILRKLGLQSAIIVPLNAYGLTLGVMTLGWSASRQYTPDDIALAEEVASRCALALDNARLYRAESAARAAAEVAQQRLAFLASASRVLMSSTEMSTQLGSLAQYIVPTLADWCTINLIESDGSIRLAAAVHREANKTARISELIAHYPSDPAVAGTWRVLRTGLPETSSRISRDRSGMMDDSETYVQLLDELGFNSYMIVPLKARGTVSGTLLLVSVNAGRPYTQADLTLAEELAAYAALAIDGARSYQEAQQLNIELDQRVKERTALLQANNEMLQQQIAERLRAEAELAEVQQQQAQGREGERSHLARELHDGPVQDLYGISYRLAATKDALTTESAQKQFSAAQAELQHVIQTLRNISSELRPPTLTFFGLKVAIQSHAKRFQASHPELHIQLDLTPDQQRLSETVRLTLFRIYQQMLSNVARHAQAQHVLIRLTLDAREVTLDIHDDGRGFEVPARWIDLARQGHLGLIGAAERAETLAGKLTVRSAPGKGTHISVSIPLPSSQARDTQPPYEDDV